jgi:hypothetical protein
MKRTTRLLAACAFAILAAGCGATPPQAPAVQANRVASALEGIAQACGEAYQQRALPRFGPSGNGSESEALMRTRELADVVERNPDWVYQGDTLRQVAVLAGARLRECGLTSAAQTLRRWAAIG